MKKINFLIVLILSFFVFSLGVEAKVEKLNLSDTFKDEIKTFTGVSQVSNEIEVLKNADLSNYQESDDKVNVYMFRGDSCSHCLEELVYFANIVNEEGMYFNFYSFETWRNKSNYNIAVNVAEELGSNFDGSVPFTVVGDKIYSGFGEETGTKILGYIKELYNNKDRYDIKDYVDLNGESIGKNQISTIVVILLLILIIGVAGFFIFKVSKSS